MESQNRIFEESPFTEKEAYSEDECLKYFSGLKQGIYKIPAIGWLVRIEEQGAYLIREEDHQSLHETKNEHPSFKKIKTPPQRVLDLFSKKTTDVNLSLDKTTQKKIMHLLMEPEFLRLYQPDKN